MADDGDHAAECRSERRCPTVEDRLKCMIVRHSDLKNAIPPHPRMPYLLAIVVICD
jgi:hypothetical protein